MSAKKKQTDSPTLPQYQGLVARTCATLKISPAVNGDEPLFVTQFKALCEFNAEHQVRTCTQEDKK